MFHHIATEMVQIHNVIFRGLNSIYLQAEQVSAADGKAFCNYMAQWSRVLHLHHEGEELIFFPAVERLTGDKSLMEVNLEQHAAFHDGVERFDEYVNACLAGRETFSGKRVVELIDGFGPVLATHLTDEIGTLLALEKYNEKLKELPPIVEEQAKHGMVSSPLTKILQPKSRRFALKLVVLLTNPDAVSSGLLHGIPVPLREPRSSFRERPMDDGFPARARADGALSRAQHDLLGPSRLVEVRCV